MAFKLAASDSFWFTVKVAQVNEAGKTLENHIPIKFKRLDIDQRREREMKMGGEIYQQLLAETDGDVDAISGKFTAQMIRDGMMNKTADDLTDELLDIIVDWKDVENEKGPMEFSRDNLLELVRFIPNFPVAVNDAYRLAYSGELKRGN